MSGRRRRRALAALAVIAAAGGGLSAVHATHKAAPAPAVVTRLAVSGEVDASRSPAIDSESSVAIDPRNPRVLLAGSNVVGKPWMGAYGSVDGGRHWRSYRIAGPRGPRFCGTSDPSTTIDRHGRQFFAFLGLRCDGRHLRSSQIYVSSRRSARSRWHTVSLPIARRGRWTLMDDRPFLTVDDGARSPHRGRLYAGWTRFVVDPATFFVYPDEADDLRPVSEVALTSHSDDGGRHWSKPSQLSGQNGPLEVRLATAADGAVYAVWRDEETAAIEIARSGDGTHFGGPQLVAGAVVRPELSCGGSRARIRAQPKRCVSPNPVVSVDTSRGPRAGRVYVTWGTTALNGSQDVYVAAFDPRLQPLLGVGHVEAVNPPEHLRGPDQFLPASAVDPSDGRLWVCYYAGSGRWRTAASSRYTCTASDDGGETWLPATAVASRASNETRRQANRANGYGDYEGVAAADGIAHPVWTDGRSLGRLHEEIYTASVRAVARTGPDVRLTAR